MRQTTALLLAASLHQKFDKIRLGAAVASDDGFYVDSDKDEIQVSADELSGLEDSIKKNSLKTTLKLNE